MGFGSTEVLKWPLRFAVAVVRRKDKPLS